MPPNSAPASELLLAPSEDSAMPLERFLMEQYLPDAEPVLQFHIIAGRDAEGYDPESLELDDDRGKPDPVFRAYDADDGYILTLAVPYHDHVFFALHVEGDLTPATLQLLTSVDDDYDGIHEIRDYETTDQYESVQHAVELLADRLST